MAPAPIDVSIVTSGHDIADARLHRLTAALTRQGMSVEMLGLGDPTDGPDGATVVAEPRGSLTRRALRALRYARRAHGAVLLAPDPDSLVAALAVGLVRRRRVVADVHEDYVAVLRDRGWAHGWRGVAGRILARAALALSGRAALVLVADDHVPPQRARRRLVVRNYPDLAMLPAPADRGPVPRAVYVGDLRESRGVWDMIEAVRRAPGWELDLVGGAPPDVAARLRGLEGDPDLAGRLRWHGRMPPRQSWAVAQGAWVGLCLLHDTPAYRAAIPSKLYEYFACGLPAVVSDLPRQAQLVRESGGGVTVPKGEICAQDVAACLRAWADAPKTLDGMREAALTWRLQHPAGAEYEAAARAVASLVDRGGC